MLNSLTTNFISRLRAQDQAAWFELWQTFGPVLQAQLSRWGKGRIGPDTVQDLSQETLAALSDCIDRYDPSKGARFSTWLLAIAKHVLGDEIDRRNAQKRGGLGAGKFISTTKPPSTSGPAPAGSDRASDTSSGTPRVLPLAKAISLDEAWMTAASVPPADQAYEAAVFAAKVHAALRHTEKHSEFADFEIFRMRVLDAIPGKDVAESLGISEPTVSRRLARVRDILRTHLSEIIATYSFTADELAEARVNGVDLLASKGDDTQFDDAVGEIYRRARIVGESDEAPPRR